MKTLTCAVYCQKYTNIFLLENDRGVVVPLSARWQQQECQVQEFSFVKRELDSGKSANLSSSARETILLNHLPSSSSLINDSHHIFDSGQDITCVGSAGFIVQKRLLVTLKREAFSPENFSRHTQQNGCCTLLDCSQSGVQQFPAIAFFRPQTLP